MADENQEAVLLSALRVEASSRTGELAAIAVLAEAGVLADEDFLKRCVDLRVRSVDWWAATDFAADLAADSPRRASILSAIAAWWRAPDSPASSLGDLQVVIDLDGVSAQQLALWRDAFVVDDPNLEHFHGHVELCVDELQRQGACWRCGGPGSAVEDDLPVCTTCKEIA